VGHYWGVATAVYALLVSPGVYKSPRRKVSRAGKKRSQKVENTLTSDKAKKAAALRCTAKVFCKIKREITTKKWRRKKKKTAEKTAP